MEPNELRKGNIIAFEDESDDIVEVVGGLPGTEPYTAENYFVYWKKIAGNSNFANGNSEIGEFMGVKLSPEILEACGFEYDNGYYQDEKGKLFFSINFNDTMFFAYAGEWNHLSNYYGIGYVDHLHQLQNLYFALTHTELQIDEKIFRKTAEKYS